MNSKYSCNAEAALIRLINNKNDLTPYVWLADTIEKRFPKSRYVKDAAESLRGKARMLNEVVKNKDSPGFELKGSDKKTHGLYTYHSNYVLLDFWASWCTPCIEEMPKTIEIQKKYADKGLKVITISIDKNKEAWLKAIEEHNMQGLINLHDEKGGAAKAYNVSYVPLTVLINPEGKIIGSNLRGEELDEKLEQVFNK